MTKRKERRIVEQRKEANNEVTASNSCIVDSTTSAEIAPPTSRGQAPRSEAFAYFLRL
jgi:hypothetical protein